MNKLKSNSVIQNSFRKSSIGNQATQHHSISIRAVDKIEVPLLTDHIRQITEIDCERSKIDAVISKLRHKFRDKLSKLTTSFEVDESYLVKKRLALRRLTRKPKKENTEKSIKLPSPRDKIKKSVRKTTTKECLEANDELIRIFTSPISSDNVQNIKFTFKKQETDANR